jgi:hypothetical protein
MLSPVQVEKRRRRAKHTNRESECRFITSVCARESSLHVWAALCIYCERRKGHFISPSLNVIANYDRVCTTVLLIRPLNASKFSCPLLLFQFGWRRSQILQPMLHYPRIELNKICKTDSQMEKKVDHILFDLMPLLLKNSLFKTKSRSSCIQ